ncbi:hypothetical protein C900_00581 [Fulvivirga imtechensis AK7]|uniref:Integral membrane protein n=1 Tax=Fulvivirga imtechensis AK7 TaxID=1237149 RepID=L8JJ78_9BACT|nr:hypothetical protein [Fulvivirga imtechensis]ELR68278.1 hypothetical protein C900_00581 [Fulvivirga imtechensis AK7]
MIDLTAFLFPLLFKLPQMVIIGFCLYYWSKRQSIDGILMTIGSVIIFAVSVFTTFAPQFLFNTDTDYVTIMMYVSGIGGIGSIAFAVGFGIMIASVLKEKRNTALDDVAGV